jgi:hypothetical protein
MHQAIIAQVEKLIQIEGADKVQIALILGEYCVVSKDVTEGMLGVLFPADLQLSEEYCRVNNLHRDSERNADTTKKGFFDKNRKVRAQKFLKVNSTAYFASLESLHYTGVFEFNLMDKFNDLNGVPICKRFVSEESLRKSANVENSKARKVNEVPLFMKHVDTEQFAHNVYKIQKGALLSFHSKRHGTSGRYALLPTVQTLPTWKKLINKVVNIFPEEEYDLVVGSRNVVLKNPDKEGFHGSESFRFQVMDQLVPHLKEGMCVYVEIVGNVNGKSIMPAHSVKELKSKDYTAKYGDSINYSYGCKDHEFKFFIYRITMTGTDGEIYEYDQKRLENWCNLRGLNTTLEVHPQMIYDGDEDALKALVTQLTERPDVLTEDYEDPKHVSEGIIIRIDYNGRTDFMKSKSVAFKIMEGIMKEDDIETLS